MKNITNLAKLTVFAVSFIFIGMASTIDAQACGNKCKTVNTDKASKTVKPEDAKLTTAFLASDALMVKDGEEKKGEGEAEKAEEAKEGKEGKCGEGKCGESKKAEKAEEGKKGESKCGEGKCGEGKCG